MIERYEPVTETIDALHKGTGDILDSGFVETIMDSWKDTSTKMINIIDFLLDENSLDR